MSIDTAPRPTRNPSAPAFVTGLRDHGTRIAVLDGDESLTYLELADRVDTAAVRVAGPRRLVLVEATNTLPALVGYLGALRAGHVVLLAPGADAATTSGLVAAWEPDVVVAADGQLRVDRAVSRHDLHPDLSLLMATSGSTGSPRLVRLTASSLDANAVAIASSLGIRSDDRAVTTLPMHYCYGLSVVHSNLHAGAALILDERSVTDPSFWADFRARRGTSLHGVPYTFDLLDRAGFTGMDLPHLRYVTQAGGRLAPDQVRRWARLGAERGWDLVVMYGQTEATARMAYLPPSRALAAPEAIGVPVPGGELRIDGPDADGIGELVYAGPNVMLGYATTPADLALGRTVDALRTGDLGRRRDDGLVEVVGRRARFVKPFGVRVDLDGLEALLAGQGVAAAVTGTDEGLVVAAVHEAPHDAGPLTTASREHDLAASVTELLTARLPLPAHAITVVVVDELPRRANGKLDHPAVAALVPAPSAPAAVRTGLVARLRSRLRGDRPTRTVRGIFAETFPGRDLPDDASFVDLGGDSLTYVRVSTEIERALGHLPHEWDRTPLGELARRSPRRSRGATLESVVVLRALAILLVVGEHDHLWTLLGGAHLLLAVAGWTFARFLLGPGADTGRARSLRILRSAALVAVPSALWILFRATTQSDVHAADALLLGSVFHPLVQGYWFVDALVQILVITAALFAIPAVRRLDCRAPFGLAAATMAAALALRLLPSYDHTMVADLYSTHLVLWLFVLGWMLQRATTVPQKWVTAIAAAALVVPFFGTEYDRAGIVLAGLAVLMLVPRVRLPRVLAGPVGAVAAASLGIYLTHFALLPLLTVGVPPVLLVPVDLLVGIVAWWLATSGVRQVADRMRTARAPT
ncbi:AMP-binding protein [Actinomycetospora sp. CA-053990]|uniref:AMP-binding protein n=1 Tax=Actinomycetospora sp. CA-053990 TaxID=3239891 RepID=UPI003D94D74E